MPLSQYLLAPQTPPVFALPLAPAPGDMLPGAVAAVPKLYPAGISGFTFLYQELSTLSALVSAGGSSGDFSEPSSVPQTFWPNAPANPFSVVATGFGEASVELSFGKHNTTSSGLTGMHMGKRGTWNFPVGCTLDVDGLPIWDTLALDATTNPADLVLAYSHHNNVKADVMRFRQDTGQVVFGQFETTPAALGGHVQVHGGKASAARPAISTKVYGNHYNLRLDQANAGTSRVKIGFGEPGFQMGLDSAQDTTRDLWISNDATGLFPLLIGTGDQVTLGTAAGTSSVKLMGLNGFHGTTPVAKPALNADLRAGLLSQGLITGGANPLNCNGGAISCGALVVAGQVSGSGTPWTGKASTITPATDSDITLTTSEMESPFLSISTGAWTAPHNLIVPSAAAGMSYWVRNNGAHTVTIKTSGGTGAAVLAGKIAFVLSIGGVNFTLGPST